METERISRISHVLTAKTETWRHEVALLVKMLVQRVRVRNFGELQDCAVSRPLCLQRRM
jgi:hypothetical protein